MPSDEASDMPAEIGIGGGCWGNVRHSEVHHFMDCCDHTVQGHVLLGAPPFVTLPCSVTEVQLQLMVPLIRHACVCVCTRYSQFQRCERAVGPAKKYIRA